MFKYFPQGVQWNSIEIKFDREFAILIVILLDPLYFQWDESTKNWIEPTIDFQSKSEFTAERHELCDDE